MGQREKHRGAATEDGLGAQSHGCLGTDASPSNYQCLCCSEGRTRCHITRVYEVKGSVVLCQGDISHRYIGVRDDQILAPKLYQELSRQTYWVC